MITCVMLGGTLVPMSADAEDLVIIDPGEKHAVEAGCLATRLFGAVRTKDVDALRKLASPEEGAYLQARLSNAGSSEYRGLFLEDGSPGRMFSSWKSFRWIAASNGGSTDRGILVCLSDGSAQAAWPPEAGDIRRLEQEGLILCVYSYPIESGRVLAFGFLHSEEY